MNERFAVFALSIIFAIVVGYYAVTTVQAEFAKINNAFEQKISR